MREEYQNALEKLRSQKDSIQKQLLVKSKSLSQLGRILSQKEPLKEMETVYAKTKLFGYVFESTESEPDVKWILSHSYPGY